MSSDSVEWWSLGGRRSSIDWSMSSVDPQLLRRMELAVYEVLGGADADLNNEISNMKTQIADVAHSVESMKDRFDAMDANVNTILGLLQRQQSAGLAQRQSGGI